MEPLRIGILQVNHDKSEDIGDRFPDDSHRFRDLFDQLDTRFRYRVYMTIGGELPESPDEQDGFLITGSPLSALDDSLPWLAGLMDFIRECDRAKVPMIGACFGHQAIARALGGRLVKREGDITSASSRMNSWRCRPASTGVPTCRPFTCFMRMRWPIFRPGAG